MQTRATAAGQYDALQDRFSLQLNERELSGVQCVRLILIENTIRIDPLWGQQVLSYPDPDSISVHRWTEHAPLIFLTTSKV
jgi:hypothetical protein